MIATESNYRRRLARAGLALVVTLFLAAVVVQPALAISCQQWSRLSEADRFATVESMIDRAIDGQSGRQYNINRNAVARCLDQRISRIVIDFDDTCADSRTAGMSALNNLFKEYIWACVN
jgi:hypothetical protein